MGARFTKADLRRAVEVAKETGSTVEMDGDVIRIVPARVIVTVEPSSDYDFVDFKR